MPEGSKTAVRDICMVLRSAHYTVLLSAETVSQRGAARGTPYHGRHAAEDGNDVRHEQELTAWQWQMVEKDMGRDAFRAGYSTQGAGGDAL